MYGLFFAFFPSSNSYFSYEFEHIAAKPKSTAVAYYLAISSRRKDKLSKAKLGKAMQKECHLEKSAARAAVAVV